MIPNSGDLCSVGGFASLAAMASRSRDWGESPRLAQIIHCCQFVNRQMISAVSLASEGKRQKPIRQRAQQTQCYGDHNVEWALFGSVAEKARKSLAFFSRPGNNRNRSCWP
jgi:hypothetical protein